MELYAPHFIVLGDPQERMWIGYTGLGKVDRGKRLVRGLVKHFPTLACLFVWSLPGYFTAKQDLQTILAQRKFEGNAILTDKLREFDIDFGRGPENQTCRLYSKITTLYHLNVPTHRLRASTRVRRL